MKKLLLVFLLFLASASPAYAAVTFDNKQGGQTSSVSYTVGANPNEVVVLFVAATNGNAGGTITTPDLGGVSFTQIDGASVNGVGNNCSTWILTGVAAGAQTLNLNSSGFNFPSQIFYTIYSYSAAAQAGQPDAHNLTTGGNTGTVSSSVTTVAANSLIVGFGFDTGGSLVTVTTGTNNALTSTANSKSGDFGVLAAGTSKTTSVTSTGAPRCASEVSIAPAVAAPTLASFLLGLVHAFWIY